MKELSEALGAPKKVKLGSSEVDVYPLDFNDMVEIEERSGKNVDDLDMNAFLKTAKNQRWFFWLALRKTQPDMTEQEVGRLFPIGSAKNQAALMSAIFAISGLAGEAEDGDPNPAAASASASAA